MQSITSNYIEQKADRLITLALEKCCFTSWDLNLLKSFADLIARRDFVQIAKSRGGILVARAYKWKYAVSIPDKNIDLLDQGPHGIIG